MAFCISVHQIDVQLSVSNTWAADVRGTGPVTSCPPFSYPYPVSVGNPALPLSTPPSLSPTPCPPVPACDVNSVCPSQTAGQESRVTGLEVLRNHSVRLQYPEKLSKAHRSRSSLFVRFPPKPPAGMISSGLHTAYCMPWPWGFISPFASFLPPAATCTCHLP